MRLAWFQMENLFGKSPWKRDKQLPPLSSIGRCSRAHNVVSGLTTTQAHGWQGLHPEGQLPTCSRVTFGGEFVVGFSPLFHFQFYQLGLKPSLVPHDCLFRRPVTGLNATTSKEKVMNEQ